MNSIVNKILHSTYDGIEVSTKDIEELGLTKTIGNALFSLCHNEEAHVFELKVFEQYQGYMLTFRNNEKLYLLKEHQYDDTIGYGIYNELVGKRLMNIRKICPKRRPITVNSRKSR